MADPARPADRLMQRFERAHVRPRPGRTLIVGSHLYGGKEDRRLRYKRVVGVDMQAGPGVDVVAELGPQATHMGMFAHIECLSVLEHAKRPWEVARYIEDAMEPGSTLFLSVPFVWRLHGYPNDYWRFTAAGVRELFPGIEWRKLMYAHVRLTEKDLVQAQGETEQGIPLMPRCEVLGFGVRQ